MIFSRVRFPGWEQVFCFICCSLKFLNYLHAQSEHGLLIPCCLTHGGIVCHQQFEAARGVEGRSLGWLGGDDGEIGPCTS